MNTRSLLANESGDSAGRSAEPKTLGDKQKLGDIQGLDGWGNILRF
jgi:hypothetical protein